MTTKNKRFTKKDHVYQNPTVNADSFDKRRYNELLHMSKGLQRMREEGKEQPHFDNLMGDIWSGFFKNKPELLNENEVSNELAVNHNLMERVLNDDFFHESHEFTKLDDLHSALNTVGFSQRVLQWIEELVDTDDTTNDSFQNMKEQEKKHGEGSNQHNESIEQFIKTLREQMENADGDDFTKMLQQSIKGTKEIEDRLKSLIGGIEAGKEDGELKSVPLRDQFALAEYLQGNHKMKRIAEWAGRFKAIARSKQKSISKESMARTGVTLGNDIDRILPSEMINLANPVAKSDFLRRFAEGETLQYATKGKQTLGKGSIILCLDQSGSMDQLDTQSKGFTLALMGIAKKQKRDFALVTFANYATVRQYPKGKISASQMVTLCEQFLNGGTNFKDPLCDSLELIKGSRFKNADIVFVTDGEDTLSKSFIDNFNKEKEKIGFSVVSLLIGNAREETVRKFSDNIFHAKDFNDKNSHEVFKI